MPLSADEKRRAAKYLIRTAYKKLNITASVDVLAIEAAAEAIYDYLNGAGVQAAINNEFPEPFKSDASAAEKAIIVAVAALHIAGELPN
jgi:hypothetical protein